MNLIVINDGQDFRARVAPDAWMISINAKTDKVRGMSFSKTYLIGISEEEFKQHNEALHQAICRAMLASEGTFIS